MTLPLTITAADLAGRIARREHVTVLDVREDPEWPIEGPSVAVRHVAAPEVLAHPQRVAAGLEGPVAVVCQRGITAQPVARALRALGVEAHVVEHGMRGWLAALRALPVDLGRGDLAVVQVQRPGRGCLSYVVASEGEAIVVDPALDTGFYVAVAAGLGASIRHVVDTHLHADHLSGARVLAESTGAALRLPAASLARGVAYADDVQPLEDGDELALGAVVLRVIALPGHTTDMTGVLVDGRALLAGDSLFADGLARPDLERGDPAGARVMGRLLHATLHERVLSLGDDVVLLPGHTHPGVRDAAVAPSLREVRAAVPELAINAADEFAEALLTDMPPRPANYEAVIAANCGTRPPDPEIESGGNSCSTRRARRR